MQTTEKQQTIKMDELDGQQSCSSLCPRISIATSPSMQPHLFELRIIIAFAIWMEIFGWEIYG